MAEPWHFFIHSLNGRSATDGVQTDIFGHSVNAIQLRPTDLRDPFPQTFDDVRQRIESETGGYCEGDGAFGWHPPNDSQTHLCGTIHCLDERVMCFELHADLTPDSWLQLSEILGITDQVAIQFPEYGIFVTPQELHRLLAVAS
jgi:hypothetical protein